MDAMTVGPISNVHLVDRSLQGLFRIKQLNELGPNACLYCIMYRPTSGQRSILSKRFKECLLMFSGSLKSSTSIYFGSRSIWLPVMRVSWSANAAQNAHEMPSALN